MSTWQGAGRVDLDFSNQVRLSFNVRDTLVCRKWLDLLRVVSPAHLAPGEYNHRHGFANEGEIHKAVWLLRRYALSLGYQLESLTPDNWHEVLNRLHKHFPPSFKRPLNRTQFLHAHQMNLIIHWLELELENKLQNRQRYCFILDFNHVPSIYRMKQKFSDEDFLHFEPNLDFGTIYLHYIHIGKHFLEMFESKDAQCPAEQFVPQTEFNATCGVALHEPSLPVTSIEQFKQFYLAAGGFAKFGMHCDDPRLAIGFYPLGQLVDIEQFKDAQARQNLREKLRGSTVIGWNVTSSCHV